MSEEYRKLSRDELDALAGHELPERAVMSLVNADLAVPTGEAPGEDGAGREGDAA